MAKKKVSNKFLAQNYYKKNQPKNKKQKKFYKKLPKKIT